MWIEFRRVMESMFALYGYDEAIYSHCEITSDRRRRRLWIILKVV